MKRVKQVKADGFYIFSGRSNANSCFIEKLKHAKQFLLYANYFLKGYVSIYDYVITKDGWTMLVKIKSKSHLAKNGEEVWKVISERIRLFLSTFVRVTNKDKGRTGCLVHSGYERYLFVTLKEAQLLIEGIRNQQIKIYYRKPKYRGLKSHYKISKEQGKGSVFLCSRDVRKVKKTGGGIGEVFDFIDLRKFVLEKLVNSTLEAHSNRNSSTFHSKLIKNSS